MSCFPLYDNLIEKYKTTISDINALQLDAQNMRGQIQEISELLKRLASRLNDFASKDDVKVLERYASYWSPLNYVTKEEVGRRIDSNIKDITSKNIDKEDISNMIKEHLPAKSTDSSAGLSKEDISNLITAEVGKLKSPEKSLSKEDVLQIVKDSLKDLPKSSGKGLSEADVIKITKKHIEDLFGKL